MTLFSLTPLVFLVPYVWDGAAQIVKRALRAGGALLVALSESGRSAARPDSDTAATAGFLPPAAEQVPDFSKVAA